MLKLIKKAAGVMLEVAGLRVPGAAEGQTLVVNADGVFTPGAGGGTALPAGTNGGVLAHAASSWASTGAGTAGQVLTSNGAAAPTWQDASAGDGPPTGTQWFDGVKAAWVLGGALPSAFMGDYSTGIRFRVLSNRSITGA